MNLALEVWHDTAQQQCRHWRCQRNVAVVFTIFEEVTYYCHRLLKVPPRGLLRLLLWPPGPYGPRAVAQAIQPYKLVWPPSPGAMAMYRRPCGGGPSAYPAPCHPSSPGGPVQDKPTRIQRGIQTPAASPMKVLPPRVLMHTSPQPMPSARAP